MWSSEGHEIRSAGGQYRIGVIRLVDVANRHGGEPTFVAYPVTEWSLEHTAIDGLLTGPGLSRRNIDKVGALSSEGFTDQHGLLRRNAVAICPVSRRNSDRHRFVGRPYGAHG